MDELVSFDMTNFQDEVEAGNLGDLVREIERCLHSNNPQIKYVGEALLSFMNGMFSESKEVVKLSAILYAMRDETLTRAFILIRLRKLKKNMQKPYSPERQSRKAKLS